MAAVHAADGSAMASDKATVPAKPLIEVTVTVVLALTPGRSGTVFGARLIAKAGVVTGGTTFSVIVRVCIILPLAAVTTRGYLPSVAPPGTLIVIVAVVGVPTLGVIVAAGVML